VNLTVATGSDPEVGGGSLRLTHWVAMALGREVTSRNRDS
jgi:hypothetical protein